MRKTIAILFLLIWGEATMAAAQTDGPSTGDDEPLILDVAPPGVKIITLDITGKQQLLGGGTQKDIDVQDGKLVTPGDPLVYYVRPQSNPVALNGELPVSKANERYYMIWFNFTLNLLKGRRVKELTFHARLDTASATARMLYPLLVTTPEEVKNNFEVGFSFSAVGKQAEAGAKWNHSIGFTHLIPIVKSFGIGTREFSWVFQGLGNSPVEEGSRGVAAIVSVPSETKELGVTFTWGMELERRFLTELFGSIPAKVQTQTSKLLLQPELAPTSAP